jgi:hypothetical protein
VALLRWFRRLALAGLLAYGPVVPAARAEPSAEISPYEQQTLAAALERHEAEIDPNPEGKRIEGIDIDVLDIIEERDPAPNFLNWFHATTRDHVVQRELLQRVGDRYRQELVDESQRNLRSLRQHSVVLCRALRGSRPDAVRLLVVVKDVWSLRLNSDFRFKAGQLEYLFLQPSEENLLGTHRRLAGAFVYKPDTLAFGGRIVEPRLASTRYVAAADANIIVNHSTGDAEGSYGFFQYGLPLYSTRQKWSWGSEFQWRKEITRRFTGTELSTYDAAVTPADDAIPYVYDTSTLLGRLSVTRSFGTDVKQDVQVGMEASRALYSPQLSSGVDPAAAAEFVAEELPVSDVRTGPYVQYHLYLNTFDPLLDVETLGLQEDYLVGPSWYVRVYPLPQFLGSSRDVLGSYSALAYTARAGDALLRGYAAGTVEVDLGTEKISDAAVQGGLRAMTPRLGFGRFVYDGTLLHRPKNYLNQRSTLGGGGRLRGYPSDAFLGKDLWASNLEFRTRALQLWTVQLGGVLFYDAGDAFDGFSDLEVKQGAGFGLRLVFPQLERAVTRIDWGFPLTATPVTGGIFDGLVITFRQAFGMPQVTGREVDLEPP